MANATRTMLVLLAVGLTGGCTQESPEAAARAAGLLPVQAELVAVVEEIDPITNPYLKAVKASLAEVRDAKFPTLPPPPDYAAFMASAPRSGYAGWETDRVDASTFDTLTNSLNAIMQRMGPDEAKQFDSIAKYVLMNVTRDPMVAKKSVGGGQISDAEILQMVQSYVHDRTPRDLTELAERFKAAEQKVQLANQRAPGG